MHASTLASTPDFTIRRVHCPGGPASWSPTELGRQWGLVLVHRGVFRVRDEGREALAEPTTAYLQMPGREQQFAHPHGGDECTSITVSTEFWRDTFADAPAHGAVTVDARMELTHLLLLRDATGPDHKVATAERLVELLGQAVRATASEAPEPLAGRPRSGVAHRLAQTAREAILTAEPAADSLTGLARHLGVSPYHLSRVFSTQTGRSVTQFRNRVRVSRALSRLHHGEDNLARLAADLGFADQAHLARTIKAHTDQPPSVLRRLLDVRTKP